MPSCRFGTALLAVCVSLCAVTAATAQSQAKLEILTRQGDFYWVVETAADGSRRGGWVNVQVPLDRIDRSALQPIPALPPLPAAQQGAPEAPSVNERLMRIEQALATGQAAGAEGTNPPRSSASSPAPQGAQPRPQPSPTARLQTRKGFWFNGGLGLGVAGCVGCASRELGASGGLSLGGTVSPRVLLGVGTAGWSKVVDGVTISGGTLDARIRFYPSLQSGFFLTVGGGLGTISAWNAFESVSEKGSGALFGLGWDVRVGRNVSLTPFYNGFAVGVQSGTYLVDQFGVGVTIH